MDMEVCVERILDEYRRWRSYDADHAYCMAALRDRNMIPRSIIWQASDDNRREAIRLLEAAGDIYPEQVHDPKFERHETGKDHE